MAEIPDLFAFKIKSIVQPAYGLSDTQIYWNLGLTWILMNYEGKPFKYNLITNLICDPCKGRRKKQAIPMVYLTKIINPSKTLNKSEREREKKKYLQQRQCCFTTSSLHVFQKVRLILHRTTRQRGFRNLNLNMNVNWKQPCLNNKLTMMRTLKGFPGCCLSILLSRS